MAKREAIRELQARLASRLQAVQEGANPAQWLAVLSGAQRYLLPLAQAGEIHALEGLQAVPHTQAWFLGVLNVRGSLSGVVDLQGFLDRAEGPAPWATAQGCVITLNPALEVNCALAVSALAGLRGGADFVSTQPAQDQGLPALGARHTDAEGVVWQEINLQALCTDPGFLHISA